MSIKQLTKEQCQVIAEAYRRGDDLKAVASDFDINVAEVSYVARRAGCPARMQGRHKNGSNGKAPATALQTQITALEEKLRTLRAKRAAQQINFEWMDETTVVVYGVTEYFIGSEGMAKLRAEIEKRVPQHGR